MIWRAALIASIALASALPAHTQPANAKAIEALHGRCRGGSGDLPSTWDACRERDSLIKSAQAQGWCVGSGGVWQTCPTAAEDTSAIAPLNSGALGVALQRCSDRAVASADRPRAFKDCADFTTDTFNFLDELRQMPRMRPHIWGACAEASGYTSRADPDTILLFAGCAGLMSKRCLTGSVVGGELDQVSCVAAINELGWVPQVYEALQSPSRKTKK